MHTTTIQPHTHFVVGRGVYRCVWDLYIHQSVYHYYTTSHTFCGRGVYRYVGKGVIAIYLILGGGGYSCCYIWGEGYMFCLGGGEVNW